MLASLLEGVHPHLLLNHIPVVLMPSALLLLLAGVLFRSRDLERAGLVACVAAALSTLPVYWTGEPAEDVVRGLAGVAGPSIEEHAQSGSFALAASLALGAVAAVAVFLSLRRGAAPRGAVAACVVLALLAAIVLARTAYLGGEIRHTEIHAPPASD